MPQAAGRFRPQLAALGEDDVGASMFHGHAAGNRPGVRFQPRCEVGAPAEFFQGVVLEHW